jgi:hypothetical protein
MRWLRWNWLDRGLLPLLLALLRFCWLWPWLALLRELLTPSHQEPLLTAGWIIGLPLVSFTLSQAAPAHDASANKPSAIPQTVTPLWARVGIALAGFALIVLSLWWHEYRNLYPLWDGRWLAALGDALIHWPELEAPAVWLMLLALIYLWLRGMLDAAQPMSHDDIWGAVIAGVVALVGYLLVATLLEVALPANLGGLVLLFFAVGMMALALSSLKITVGLDYALGYGQRRSAKTPQTTRYWLISVLAVVGGLLGLGLVITLVVAPDQVARLLAVVNQALGFVWQLVGLVLTAIAYVLFVIIYFLIMLLRPLLERLLALLQGAEPPQQEGIPEPTPPPDMNDLAVAAMPDAYRWLALAIFLVAVVVIFALVLRKMRAGTSEALDETRESILSTDLLQDQLAKLWQKWFGGLGRWPRFLSLEGEAETRRIIRGAYQGLLAAATARGQSHRREQTPTEYQNELVTNLAESDEALAAMTRRYNQARYGPEPPSPGEASEAEQAWQAVQANLTRDESESSADGG